MLDYKEIEVLDGMFSNFTEEFLKQKPCQVNPKQVINWLEDENEDVLVVDIKTQKEVSIVGFTHADSIHIPMSDLFKKENIDKLLQYQNRKIVIVCKSGFRSLVAAAFLQRVGFKNIFSLRGGIVEFVKEIEC